MIFNKSKQKQLFLNGTQQQAKYTFALPSRTPPARQNQVLCNLMSRTGANDIWHTEAEYWLVGPDDRQVDQEFIVITVILPNSRQTDLKLREWCANIARLLGVPKIICIKQVMEALTPDINREAGS